MKGLQAIYHGSPVRVERPVFGVGNPYNDYGLGFYCTESIELAREWACPRMNDGYANGYEIDLGGLKVIDLDGEPYGTLEWLAVLLAHRQFDTNTAVMRQMRDLLIERYGVALEGADVVAGYRADDSYFAYARAFLDNRITLRQLERALRLGGLGRQIVLKSERAFSAIRFLGAELVDADVWHEKRMGRDEKARREYQEMVASEEVLPDDVFAIDILRRS